MAVPPRILGAVLAAGDSRRMGRPKALLPCRPGDETFVARIVKTLTAGGLNAVVVVGRPEDQALQSAVAALEPAVEFVQNTRAAEGQLSSIQAAVEAAERSRAGGLLIMPVDIPLVRPATIAAALRAFAGHAPPILRVTCGGRHGHPAIFSAALFPDLRHADPAVGAKAVLAAHAGRILNLEVDDPGVLRDIDDAAAYRVVFGADPS